MAAQPPAKSTAPADSQPVKKLRLSCDACLAAKVKCAKERPVCSRCLDLDYACVYSKSRRTGKAKAAPASRPASTPSTAISSRPRTPPQEQDATMDWRDMRWDPRYASQPDPMLANLDIAAAAGMDPSALDSSFTGGPFNFNSTAGGNFYPFSSPDSTVAPPDWGKLMGMGVGMGPLPDQDAMSMANFSTHSSTTGSDSSPSPCICRSTLQDRVNSIDTSTLPFDQLVALNKSVATTVANYLSCTCQPDISSVMLLSSVVTQLMQRYKSICRGDPQSPDQSVINVGSLKVEGEAQHQIKLILIRSELVRIGALISRFPERFESHLQGPEWRLFKVNLEYLENDLDEMINSRRNSDFIMT